MSDMTATAVPTAVPGGPIPRRRRSVEEAVAEFSETFAVPCRTVPTGTIPEAEAQLRLTLLGEEFSEVLEALASGDPAAIAGELVDLVYVAVGTALAYGLPFDDCFAAVHEANMAKAGPDGRPLRRPDGKVVKPPGWTLADLPAVLARRTRTPEAALIR